MACTKSKTLRPLRHDRRRPGLSAPAVGSRGRVSNIAALRNLRSRPSPASQRLLTKQNISTERTSSVVPRIATGTVQRNRHGSVLQFSSDIAQAREGERRCSSRSGPPTGQWNGLRRPRHAVRLAERRRGAGHRLRPAAHLTTRLSASRRRKRPRPTARTRPAGSGRRLSARSSGTRRRIRRRRWHKDCAAGR